MDTRKQLSNKVKGGCCLRVGSCIVHHTPHQQCWVRATVGWWTQETLPGARERSYSQMTALLTKLRPIQFLMPPLSCLMNADGAPLLAGIPTTC